MCLIAYVPSGKNLPLENIRAAHYANDDGIGIMSKEGICKFLGRKALKKAIKTIALLEKAEITYAVHFRYKTHGDVILQNCHPFKVPNGAAYVMHNGVLGSYTAKATKEMSDTAVFVSEHLTAVPDDNNMDYWAEVARHIGWSNKLCVMTHDYKFILVNGDAGTYRDGIWYSQTYSLPYPRSEYAGWEAGTGGYYNSRSKTERSNEWPYHVIDCTCKTCADETNRKADKHSEGGWASRNPQWYEKLRERQKAEHGRVPTTVVTDSLRKALERRYGIVDPRVQGGMRRVREPLRLTHDVPATTVVATTPLQSLASSVPGVDADRQTQQTREEDKQLDQALHEHLKRMDDDGGYAEIELDVSSRGDALLPGWSELNTGTLE